MDCEDLVSESESDDEESHDEQSKILYSQKCFKTFRS